MGDFRQRAIDAALAVKAERDMADQQRRARFCGFAQQQFRTALIDMGVTNTDFDLGWKWGSPNEYIVFGLSAGVDIATTWNFWKYSEADDNASMDGTNPLQAATITGHCSHCNAAVVVGHTDLLQPNALSQIGELLLLDTYCSAYCEVAAQASGIEQFLADVVSA